LLEGSTINSKVARVAGAKHLVSRGCKFYSRVVRVAGENLTIARWCQEIQGKGVTRGSEGARGWQEIQWIGKGGRGLQMGAEGWQEEEYGSMGCRCSRGVPEGGRR
jgi:hypothetical protein